MKKKYVELLKGLPPDELGEFNKEFHEVICKTIIELYKDYIDKRGISQQQIDAARDFAMVAPETDAAKELLEFLDSDEIKEALVVERSGQEK
ncbi:hypothetical protein ACFLT2_13255 [Acidobacteriota bacterium]